MADLFGAGGRRLLAELDFPEPWLGHVRASVELIDDLDRRIAEIERWLQRSGADHRYIPLLMSAPSALSCQAPSALLFTSVLAEALDTASVHPAITSERCQGSDIFQARDLTRGPRS